MSTQQLYHDFSKRELNAAGWKVVAEEYYNAFSKRMHDVLGFADLLLMHPQEKAFLCVQITTKEKRNARLRKIRESSGALDFLRTGGKIWLMLWESQTVLETREEKYLDYSVEFITLENFGR